MGWFVARAVSRLRCEDVASVLSQKLLCDARVGDQRRDEAGAKYHADSVCFVHPAGHGDNLGDAAELLAGDADHALAQ